MLQGLAWKIVIPDQGLQLLNILIVYPTATGGNFCATVLCSA